MKCYLCLGTEFIVCSRLLSCFFPEPPSAQTVLVPNRKVTDVGPALWAGLYQGPDQLLYFHLCRLQGLHCKRLTDWSASRPHLTQLGSLSWKMFLFRHWGDFIETSPFKMQAHTWRWKADSQRYPQLGTASCPFLHILTTGPIRGAGCCKNRNLVLPGNPLIFLSDYNGSYSEANSIFVSAETQAWRCQKWWQELSISMRCQSAHMLHTQCFTHSDYFQLLQASEWDSATKLNLVEKGGRQNVLAVP